jgi:predicted phage terminase large subunit-like protein
MTKCDKIQQIHVHNDIVIPKFSFPSPATLAYIISNGNFKFPKHIQLLDKLLVNLSNRKFYKLIVNMPPRHGKSELISKYFPLWYLAKFPDHRIILTSYGAALAKRFGRNIKFLIDQYGNDLLDIKLNPKSRASDRFDHAKFNGGMLCAGANGALTGMGANLLIIDDPLKNNLHASSYKMRQNLWDWLNSTALTRLEPHGIIILVMTRWHENDLCGKIISDQKIIQHQQNQSNELPEDTWLYIRLPAIAETHDILARKPGEALWDKRFSLTKLKEIKNRIGSYWFAALYQQSPAPLNGGIFKRKDFRYYTKDNEFYYLYPELGVGTNRKTIPKEFCTTIAVMDMAVTTKETSDYTVIIVFRLTSDKDIIITDLIREKFEGSQHLNLLTTVNEIWKPSIIGIESVQYQLSLIQTLRKKGLAVKALKPDKDKISRALSIQARLEASKIFFPKKAPWLAEFENELLLFPNSSHDDQVDAFAYISYMLAEFSGAMPASANRSAIEKKITTGFST